MKNKSFFGRLGLMVLAITPFSASCELIEKESIEDFAKKAFNSEQEIKENQEKIEAQEEKIEKLVFENKKLQEKIESLEKQQSQFLVEKEDLFNSLKQEFEKGKNSEQYQRDLAILNSDLFKNFVEKSFEQEQIVAKIELIEEKLEQSKVAFEATKNAVRLAREAKELFNEIQGAEGEIETLKRALRLANEEYILAYYNNWFFGKEFALYLLTLKPVWGIFTGYAASTSTKSQKNNLAKVKREFTEKTQTLKAKIQKSREVLEQKVATLQEAFEAAANLAIEVEERLAFQEAKGHLIRLFASIDTAREKLAQEESIFHESLKVKELKTQKGQNVFEKRFQEASKQFEETAQKLENLFSAHTDTEKVTFISSLERAASNVSFLENQFHALNQEKTRLAKEISVLQLQQPRIVALFKGVNRRLPVIQKSIETFQKQEQEIENMIKSRTDFVVSFESAFNLANETRVILEKMQTSHNRQQAVVLETTIKEKHLQEAYKNNHRFGKELALYLFGFKWFWGIFTGFSRNPDVDAEYYALLKAKEQKEKVTKEEQETQTKLQEEFVALRNKTLSTIEQAELDAKNLSEKVAITKLKEMFLEMLPTFKENLKKASEANQNLTSQILSDKFALNLSQESLFSTEIVSTYQSKLESGSKLIIKINQLFESANATLFSKIIEELKALKQHKDKIKVNLEEAKRLLTSLQGKS